ncbi:magnesium and cobalt transport protein CorA [Pseudoneobacillus sp. C159]
MVKENGSKNKEVNKKKNPGFFAKIVFLWILPFIYSISLGMTILHFSGVSLSKQIKWMDKQSDFLFGKNEITSPQSNTSGVPSINDENNVNNNEIDSQIQDSPKQNETQEKPQIDESTRASSNQYSVSESMSNMDPSVAAKLLRSMSEADALMVLRELSVDTRTEIISEMPVDAGARFTLALANGSDIDSTTNSSSQLYRYMKPEQIAGVLMGIENREEILRQIRRLDPLKASEVLSQLDPEIAGWIITRMN